ncbi:biotin/lipoyl-binding protein [Variovorax sp. Sphag1AA]|uniref:biotin/lipoyl-binding protein n=1 Tax=Variovorax sp. Sphag1AA TaxID=2587027 RepID=UPI0016097676|nr:biotin/lipoyl-binding protein [Variovorax sp. Sphag1AA]MBB3178465.1 multidrug efflux pump subunit AcrA (membrane-fusion protein) [Variovorax sp. Sphag1AA]
MSEQEAANSPKVRHPGFDLLARYRAVFRAAWQHRHELAGPKRLSDEAAFLPAALSLQDTPVHPAPRRLAFGLIALFFIALAWAIVGRIDIVAVAPGRIIVSERTKLIQPLERSVVQRILVNDGDHVEAGQPLVELDPTTASADRVSIDEQLKSAQSEVQRTRALLQSMSSGVRPTLNGSSGLTSGWSNSDTVAANVLLASEWSDINAKLAKAAAEIPRPSHCE